MQNNDQPDFNDIYEIIVAPSVSIEYADIPGAYFLTPEYFIDYWAQLLYATAADYLKLAQIFLDNQPQATVSENRSSSVYL